MFQLSLIFKILSQFITPNSLKHQKFLNFFHKTKKTNRDVAFSILFNKMMVKYIIT